MENPLVRSTSREKTALINFVERSPAAVGVHDKSAWLSLFTEEAKIEDPMGSAPAPKADGTLERFWDTFIAPHQIRFAVLRDHVLGLDVFRDAVIHTEVAPGVNVEVSAYLLYELEEHEGMLWARRMAAHWSLWDMTLLALGMGPRAWWSLTVLFVRMLRVMGMSWVGSYLSSLWNNAGSRGLSALEVLSLAIEKRDGFAIERMFVSSGGAISFGTAFGPPEELFRLMPEGSKLTFEKPVVAGYTVTARFRVEGPSPAEGIAHFEFDPETIHLRTARFFPPYTP